MSQDDAAPRWKSREEPHSQSFSAPVSLEQFIERMADNIAKTTITLGGSVSTAYKAAALFAEACEDLWSKK